MEVFQSPGGADGRNHTQLVRIHSEKNRVETTACVQRSQIMHHRGWDDAFGKQSTKRASPGLTSLQPNTIHNPGRTPVYRSFSTLVLLASLAHPADAAVVQRCQGPQGHITFTHSNCPEAQPWVRQRALNPASGRKPMARKAAPRRLPVTIIEDGTRTRLAAPPTPPVKAPKKASRMKKKRRPKYLAEEQTPPARKLKTQKAKSPH
jgi:hypothetical protein